MIIINISKILRYLLITLLNILCVFVVQYYLNTQKSLANSISNLNITIFINSNLEKTNDEILKQLTSNSFSIVDVFDLQTKDKFLEITPELENVVNSDFATFPRFVIANNVLVDSVEEIEQLKNEILQIDFVEDFVYDNKAYKMFFDNKKFLNNYKKIFFYCSIVVCLIFLVKLIFYILKGFYKGICIELLSGGILCLLACALICFTALLFNQNQIFILNWQVLYVVGLFSLITTFLTKESNV